MVKRQRDNTPPTSDDEEPKLKLVDYSDTESSDDEDDIRPPPRKRRAMTMYSDDEDDEDLTSYFTIKAVNEKKSRLFRAQGKEFQLNIKTFPDNVSPYQFISRLFDRLVEDIKERCQMESNDKMRMTILHPGLKLGVFVTWRDVSAMTGEAVLEEIMKVLQSNENFRINDGQMTIQVTVVRLPVGSGRKPLHAGLYFESDNMRKNKQSIVQINNTKDVMCMARAVVVAKCNADKEESESWKKNWEHIRKSTKSMQTREAMKLLDQAKIPHTKPCGIEEYKKIQSVLAPKYLIKVHSQYPKDGLIFPLQFKKKSETRVIHIYYNGVDHYDAITKVTGFLGASYYCEYCDVGYTNRGAHRCADGCEDCYSDIPCIHGEKMRCMDCKRTFRSRDCFVKHKAMKSKQQKSICHLVYNCGKCNLRIVGNKKNHVCPGQRKCRNCKEIV